MKAVVWSDTLQIFLMMGSMLALVIKGLMDVGVINVWERNLNSGRLEFLKYTKKKSIEILLSIYATLFYYLLYNSAPILIQQHKKR